MPAFEALVYAFALRTKVAYAESKLAHIASFDGVESEEMWTDCIGLLTQCRVTRTTLFIVNFCFLQHNLAL